MQSLAYRNHAFLDTDEARPLRILAEYHEPLARFKKDVPLELEQVIEKLLEKEPEMRYQAASGVLVDLKRIHFQKGNVHNSVSVLDEHPSLG